MNKTTKRNIIGSIICFFLSILFGGIGIAVMMFREVYQSNKYGFQVEKDDIVRYSIIGAVGGIVHDVLIFVITKTLSVWYIRHYTHWQGFPKSSRQDGLMIQRPIIKSETIRFIFCCIILKSQGFYTLALFVSITYWRTGYCKINMDLKETRRLWNFAIQIAKW